LFAAVVSVREPDDESDGESEAPTRVLPRAEGGEKA
jgi:arabinofuranan 3-O-arabinosyltransferase